MPNQGKLLTKDNILCVVFCKELTLGLFNTNLWTEIKISFLSQYHNIVRQNVSCEYGLNLSTWVDLTKISHFGISTN